MKNKEKAEELDEKFRSFLYSPKEGPSFQQCLLEMAEWKEQEIIERASLFFIDFFKELPDGPNKFKIKRDCSIEQLIEEFIKTVKD